MVVVEKTTKEDVQVAVAPCEREGESQDNATWRAEPQRPLERSAAPLSMPFVTFAWMDVDSQLKRSALAKRASCIKLRKSSASRARSEEQRQSAGGP